MLILYKLFTFILYHHWNCIILYTIELKLYALLQIPIIPIHVKTIMDIFNIILLAHSGIKYTSSFSSTFTQCLRYSVFCNELYYIIHFTCALSAYFHLIQRSVDSDVRSWRSFNRLYPKLSSFHRQSVEMDFEIVFSPHIISVGG